MSVCLTQGTGIFFFNFFIGKAAHLLVDNSNIWIGAKENACKIYNFKTSQDHRVRLDYWKLTSTVAMGRKLTSCNLYGSKPPPNDALWDNAEAVGMNVIVHERSPFTGREKMVDGQIISDLMHIAYTSKTGTLLILMTGDADMVPSLEHILEATATTIELYGWEGCVSKNYFALMRRYPERVKVAYINQFHSKFTYVSVKFISRKLRKGYHDAIVFTVEKDG